MLAQKPDGKRARKLLTVADPKLRYWAAQNRMRVCQYLPALSTA